MASRAVMVYMEKIVGTYNRFEWPRSAVCSALYTTIAFGKFHHFTETSRVYHAFIVLPSAFIFSAV